MKFEQFQSLVGSLFTPAADGSPKTRYDDVRPEALHPLVLAYVGDAYFNVFVRGKLLAYEQNKVRVLHQFGAQIVSAVWQAAAFRTIEPLLDEEELAVFRRGRNAKSHVPKSASVTEYRTSTGFEALLGYLYLKERYQRLLNLAETSFAAIAQEMMDKRGKSY